MRFAKLIILAAFALAAFVLFPASQASAKAGDLDSSFGDGGIVRHVLAGATRQLKGMILQPDGKIIAVGTSTGGSAENLVAARYLPNGALDTGFATNGVYVSSFGPGTRASAEAVALQPDGKIVVAGYYSPGGPNANFLVGRFTSSGQLDPGFNGGTFQAVSADGNPGVANSVVIQPNGRIIAGGLSLTSSQADFAMIALKSDGTTAPFGPAAGYASQTVMSATNDDRIRTLLQTPGGDLVAVGDDSTQQNTLIARYSSNGILDTGFGVSGKFIGVAGTRGEGATLQSDGKIVAVGQNGSTFTMERFNSGGTLDPSFGTGGIAQLAMTGGGYGKAVVQQPDGKLVATGAINSVSGERDLAVVRLNANGTADAGFGAGGVARTSINSGDDEGEAVALQPDGKIVTADWAILKSSFSDGDFGLARFEGADPVVAPPIPVSKIKSPSKKSLKRSKFKKVSGTAGPAGSVKRVDIAIRRIDAKSLKKKRCVWLRSNKAKFKKVKSTKKRKCTSPVWLQASGTTSWIYKLKKSLPKGSYELSARTTLTDGTKQTTFTKADGNFRKLKLTK